MLGWLRTWPFSGQQLNISVGAKSVIQANYSADSINAAAQLPRIESRLNRREAIFEDGQLNALYAMHWTYRLSLGMIGRQSEFDEIVSWCRNPILGSAARIIEGDGGAGKTRLAFEVAQFLQNEGWVCHFTVENSPTLLSCTGASGLLLVVDYPDERADWQDIVQHLKDTKSDHGIPIPVRVLILTRPRFFDSNKNLGEVLDRISRKPIPLLPLSEDDSVELINRTVGELFEISNCDPKDVDEGELRAWLNREPHHEMRRPLFLIATGAHIFLDARANINRTFRLRSGDIVTALVDREIVRINSQGRKVGLEESALCRLLALATEFGGLSQRCLVRLQAPEYYFPANLLMSVAATSWWDSERDCLRGVEPDPIGSEFVERVSSSVPSHIWASWERTIMEERLI